MYIEATGHPDSVKQGIHMIAKLGTFVEYSVFTKEVTLDWTIIGDTKGVCVRTCVCCACVCAWVCVGVCMHGCVWLCVVVCRVCLCVCVDTLCLQRR